MILSAAKNSDGVVADFRSVVYIDTAVIAYLCMAASKMRQRNKRLKLKLASNTHPQRTIEITGLAAVLDAETSPKD